MSVFDLKAHQAISSWKQEAKEEDNGRYFFPVPEVEKLRTGQASFLFDRKGKGKTAVGQSILTQPRIGDLTTSLSFKNYPFNDLYRSLRDNAYKAPNQYIAGWRFLISCAVARLMADDPQADKRKRELIRSAFAPDVHEALSRRISRWVSGGFEVKVLEFGIGGQAQRETQEVDRSLSERAEIVRQFLAPELAKSRSRYYVVFDELDEDYTSSASPQERNEYFALLVGLLKAAREVRQDPALPNVYPIVLLRDDIFALLRDSDREKWMDSAVSLNWSQQRIKDLLAFRLCRAAGIDEALPFAEVWQDLVGGKPNFGVNGRNWDKFDFIGSYTMGRPRDYIYYLSYASRRITEKIEGGVPTATLSGEVLRNCIRPFADHLRRELEDEMGGQVPHIHEVMDVVLGFEDRHFRLQDFRQAHADARRRSSQHWQHSPEAVLDILYTFSAIGFVRGKAEYFRYQSPNVDLDLSRTMLLHKGLFGARRAVT